MGEGLHFTLTGVYNPLQHLRGLSTLNVLNLDAVWLKIRTHHLPNIDALLITFCLYRNGKYDRYHGSQVSAGLMSRAWPEWLAATPNPFHYTGSQVMDYYYLINL